MKSPLWFLKGADVRYQTSRLKAGFAFFPFHDPSFYTFDKTLLKNDSISHFSASNLLIDNLQNNVIFLKSKIKKMDREKKYKNYLEMETCLRNFFYGFVILFLIEI
jgi:hypothetical protein